MSSFTYNERTPKDSRSTAKYRASLKNASIVADFTIDSVAAAPAAVFVDVLGDTDVIAGNGAMRRPPPLAYPSAPWLVANDLMELEGVGSTQTINAGGRVEVPAIPQFPLYTKYIAKIAFAQRPYAVATDDRMPAFKKGITWIDSDASVQKYGDSFEYLRYTDWNRIAGSQYATATQGHMVFVTDGTGAGGVQFQGMPRLPLPDSTIKFRWYGVPYRYVVSAAQVFDKYRLRVNQFPFYNGLWAAGSLLYVDYAHMPYSPPLPQLSPYAPGLLSAQAKLVDIEFTFAHTSRTPQSLPLAQPANGNYITAGWNLQPWWGDMGFHYVTVDGTSNGRPYFLSFPFEKLFWDPDVPTV